MATNKPEDHTNIRTIIKIFLVLVVVLTIGKLFVGLDGELSPVSRWKLQKSIMDDLNAPYEKLYTKAKKKLFTDLYLGFRSDGYEYCPEASSKFDSVFYFGTFTGSQKKEYAEYEKHSSLLNLRKEALIWPTTYSYEEIEKLEKEYLDSISVYEHKMDSMASMSSRKPHFMGYIMSQQMRLINTKDYEDTLFRQAVFYFPPDISTVTDERNDLIGYARPMK